MSMLIDRTKFFAGHRAAFGPIQQLQVDGLDFLLRKFEADSRWVDIRHIAYALATIRRETGITRKVDGIPVNFMYQPIKEAGGKLYLSKYYLKSKLRHDLGNIQLSDAWDFMGRGYVQITGRRNYTLFADLLHTSLVAAPQLALEPNIAFNIMTVGMFGGHFTGKALRHYFNGNRNDYVEARRIINGLDHAAEIARAAMSFENILRGARYEIVPTVVVKP